MDAIFTNDFDSYLESFGDNYESLTEGSIGDKVKNIWDRIVEFLKSFKNAIVKLFKEIIPNAFKKAFSKDNKLEEEFEEFIDDFDDSVEEDIEEKPAASEPEKSEPSKSEAKPKKKAKPIRVPYREINKEYKYASVGSATTTFMEKHGKFGSNPWSMILSDKVLDSYGKLRFNPDEIKNKICDCHENIKESVNKDFWNGELQELILTKSLLYNIKSDYTDLKKKMNDIGKDKSINEFLKHLDDSIKRAEDSAIRDKNISRDKARDGYKHDDEGNIEKRQIKGNLARWDSFKQINEKNKRYRKDAVDFNNYARRAENELKIYTPFRSIYLEISNSMLDCFKERYKINKAAMIKCCSSRRNFDESTIERVTKVAMLETEMCFV